MAYKRRFTLIELIAVMGLIGLIVGLAAPAFSRINKGKSVNIAAETVRNALEQAQAQAIGHHRYVGLIIPNGSTNYYSEFVSSNDTPDFNADTKNKYNLASFRSAFLWKDDTTYEFDGWVPQSEWSTPLENAKVVKITDYAGLPSWGDAFTNATTSTTTKLVNSDEGAFLKIRKKSASSKTAEACAVVFTPDGGLAADSDLFLVVMGCAPAGASITPSDPEPGSSDKNRTLNYFVLHVNRMNGKVSYFQKKE